MIAAVPESVSYQGQRAGGKEQQQSVDPQVKSNREHNDQQASWVLPYLTEYLIPSARAQKAFLHQESHIATSLSTQQDLTMQLLNRLANESHLLPNYPLLSRQPRFKNAVAALGPKQPSPPVHESRSTYDARAWAFAADAARSATHEIVEQRLEHGFTHVKNAQVVLDDIRELLGSNGVDEGGREEAIETDDTGVSGSTTSNGHPPKSKVAAQRGPEGIWSGLNGKVGLGSAGPVEHR